MDRTLKIIGNTDLALNRFLDEWYSDSSYVNAHTSGSTGEPKRIRLLKSDMIESAKSTCRFFHINHQSVLFLPLSADYIAGKMMVVRALISGASLMVERPSNNPFQNAVISAPVTLMAVVPSQVPALMADSRLRYVENLIIGGAPVPEEMEASLRSLSIKAYATYGMTETCSHVALRDITSGADSYTALPGISFETDARQCLVVNCPNLSIRRVVTNDVVTQVSSASFQWVGRYDNVINSGGIKLHPEILERKIATFVSEPFYCTGRPSERWGQELIMVVESPFNLAKFKAQAVMRLKPYEIPKEIFQVDSLPHTASGKIKRVIPD